MKSFYTKRNSFFLLHSSYASQILNWVWQLHPILFFVFLPFLGPLLGHTEVPRLGVESELLPPAYVRATATQDLSHVCNLHHSSQQRRILNPVSKGETPWFLVRFINHCATTGTPRHPILLSREILHVLWMRNLGKILVYLKRLPSNALVTFQTSNTKLSQQISPEEFTLLQ